MNTQIEALFTTALGLQPPWHVAKVELNTAKRRIDFEVEHTGKRAACPACGVEHQLIHDRVRRSWRHLDFFQFEAWLHAEVPRVQCTGCGKTTQLPVPWAREGSGFTLLFEAFAIEVLLASASVSQACALLGIGWDTAQQIMQRAVERGLDRRQLDGLKRLGLDEKSFKRGQSYITLLTDLDQGRVLDVEEERTREAAHAVWLTLSPEQKQGVEAVAVDMWGPFLETIRQEVPQADIVHDRYHVSAYLNEAVDQVRRQEHKELLAHGDETLTGSRQLWLYNPMNFRPEQAADFERLKDLNLKVARAWAAKELFSKFWEYASEGWARRFFKDWFGWVSRSRLQPMVEVAHLLKRHLENLLTYLKHHITNAVTEGLNSKIQSLKAAARGFRNFANYRIRILFFCGKLDLYPR